MIHDMPHFGDLVRDGYGKGQKDPQAGGSAHAQFPSVFKRPAAHSRAMVVLAHDSSHMPFPSCSKLHTRTHSQARTHGASNCQQGIYVSLPSERAHAATPSASQHVSKHPTGRHGSGGFPAASGRGPYASPRQSRCVIMPPRCPPDASVVRPSCGASLGRSPSKQ